MDTPLRLRILNRIVNEVVEQQAQRQAVAANWPDVWRKIDLQVEPGLVELRLELLLDVIEEDTDGKGSNA